MFSNLFPSLFFFLRLLLSYLLFSVCEIVGQVQQEGLISFLPKFVDPESGLSCVHMTDGVDVFENILHIQSPSRT